MRRLLERSQIARIALGCALILAGLQLRQLDEGFQATSAQICASKPGLQCEAMHFAFVTLGLGGVWTILLVWGAYYAFLFDWIMPTLERLAQSVTAQAVDASGIVLGQIRRHTLTVEQMQRLLLAIFEHSSGASDPDGSSLGQFAADQLLFRRGSLLWRRRHSTVVRIEEIDQEGLRDRFYRWTEDTSYQVIAAGSRMAFDIPILGNTPCTLADALTIATQLRYTVRIGAAEDQFDGARLAGRSPAPDLAAGVADGQFAIRHTGGSLVVTYARRVTLSARETSISVSETSLLPRTDQDFTKFIFEPSKGLSLTLTVPRSLRIASTACCLRAYELPAGRDTAGATVPDAIIVQDDGRTARLDSDSWVLPGVAFTIVWKPATG